MHPSQKSTSLNFFQQSNVDSEFFQNSYPDGQVEISNTNSNLNLLLPHKRHAEFSELIQKKSKKLPVSYEEWAPFSRALLGLDFTRNGEVIDENDIQERKKIAIKMSTPEGLNEIINELEQNLSMFENAPVDSEFETLTLEEKIEKLFKEFCN